MNITERIFLSQDMILRLRDIWVNDDTDDSCTMTDYYAAQGWDLIRDSEYRTCSIPAAQLDFFLLSL